MNQKICSVVRIKLERNVVKVDLEIKLSNKNLDSTGSRIGAFTVRIFLLVELRMLMDI